MPRNTTPTNAAPLDHYLTTSEAAAYVKLSQSNLAKRRITGDSPEFIKIGRKVLYSTDCLDQWMAKRIRRSTSVR